MSFDLKPPAGSGRLPTGPTLGFEEFKSRRYFGALDGLRALSILLVIFHHVPHFAAPFWRVVQENGRYGVSVFFAVSGFLICTLLLRERERSGRISWGKFYARRALRLLPLYYATLALQCVLVFGLHAYSPENQQLFQAKLPSYLLYYSNWLSTATQGPFFYAWSLAVEEQFYLGFGLLLYLVPRRNLPALLVGAVLAKFIAFEVWGPIDTISTTWRVLFSYQEAILWGVVIALLLDNRKVYERVAAVFGHGAVMALVAVVTTGWLLLHPIEAQSAWDAELIYVLITAFVAGTVVRRKTPVLEWRVSRFTGKVSYGIYLLHTLVIYSLKRFAVGSDPAICFALSAPLSIGIASIVYLGFEAPILAMAKARFSPPTNQEAHHAKTESSLVEAAPSSQASGVV